MNRPASGRPRGARISTPRSEKAKRRRRRQIESDPDSSSDDEAAPELPPVADPDPDHTAAELEAVSGLMAAATTPTATNATRRSGTMVTVTNSDRASSNINNSDRASSNSNDVLATDQFDFNDEDEDEFSSAMHDGTPVLFRFSLDESAKNKKKQSNPRFPLNMFNGGEEFDLKLQID
jgi:hypothetical protein